MIYVLSLKIKLEVLRNLITCAFYAFTCAFCERRELLLIHFGLPLKNANSKQLLLHEKIAPYFFLTL